MVFSGVKGFSAKDDKNAYDAPSVRRQTQKDSHRVLKISETPTGNKGRVVERLSLIRSVFSQVSRITSDTNQ